MGVYVEVGRFGRLEYQPKSQIGKSDLVAEIQNLNSEFVLIGLEASILLFNKILSIHQGHPFPHFLLDHFEMMLLLRGNQ